MLELLDQKLPDFTIHSDSQHKLPFFHQISLNDLYFRYNPKSPYTLKGINLNISKGSRVGFIGSTGSGKSTLLDLIMGLLTPCKGKLVVDDQPICLSNTRAWQTHIAHVPQAIFLADNTIAENIAFGVTNTQIDYSRVHEVAKQAQISKSIESWPNQYQTYVGERGMRLSGGQRQRIGIARALYKRADVIILDEATSALDSETEELVMQTIEGLGPEITILIIAHRITTLKSCDQIIEIENGFIKQIGSYKNIAS
jgi:ATP-binding cassette subfamily B protein